MFLQILILLLTEHLGWSDNIFIDILGKGFLGEVREKFDKCIKKPKTLF